MLMVFTETPDFMQWGIEMVLESQREDILSMMYTLSILHYKGVSAGKTVHDSLMRLREWYEQSGDRRYLELALLVLCAACGLGAAWESDGELYRAICSLAEVELEEILEDSIMVAEHIKANKAQIRRIIGKWMPTRQNPMTKTEMVDDILDKVIHQREGQYYYHREYNRGQNREACSEDLYKLVISPEKSFLLNLKQFKVYIFDSTR